MWQPLTNIYISNDGLGLLFSFSLCLFSSFNWLNQRFVWNVKQQINGCFYHIELREKLCPDCVKKPLIKSLIMYDGRSLAVHLILFFFSFIYMQSRWYFPTERWFSTQWIVLALLFRINFPLLKWKSCING